MPASHRLALAALLLASACGVPAGGGPDRLVVADVWVNRYPTLGAFFDDKGVSRMNEIVASIEAGDSVQVERVDETWVRVRTAGGKVGFIPATYLAPAGAFAAVAVEQTECWPGRFFGSPIDKSIAPGRVLFLERRRFARWRVVAGETGCPWVKNYAFSLEPADVELAYILNKLPTARTSQVERLRERARQLASGSPLEPLLATTEARFPRAAPQWAPRPLEPGEVPASRKTPDGDCPWGTALPVPEEYPGMYAGDPLAFDVRPVETSSQTFAVVTPRFSFEGRALVRESCPWIDVDHPVGEYEARSSRRGTAECRLEPPERETGGRWYLATRQGVFAAKAGVFSVRVRTPFTGPGDLAGGLLLRPVPEGGAGFAFWSPAARTFRACAIPLPERRSTPRGLRWEALPDGRLAIVEGDGAESRRVVVDRKPAPILSGYRLEMFPGGTYLFVSLEDTSYVASTVATRWCRPAFLLRWSDLMEVARVECE